MVRRGGTVLSLLLILAGTFPQSAEGDRPFLSASAAPLVDPGVMEVELGFLITRNTRGDNDQTNASLPTAFFNMGISDRFEFDIGTGFMLEHDYVQDETLGSAADTSLTLRTLWWDGKDGAPSVATELGVLLPTARKEFQPAEEKEISWGGRVDVSGEVDRLVYIVDLGGGVGQSPGAEPTLGNEGNNSVFLWALAGELAVTERVHLVSEFQGQVFFGGMDIATALLGFTYTTPSGVTFDCAGFTGLTEGSDNWGVTFGVTFDFRVVSGTSNTSR